jgi:ribose transport system permease protein
MTQPEHAVVAGAPDAPPHEAPDARAASRRPINWYLEAYALVGLLIAAAIFFSLYGKTADTFPTSANIQVLISSNSVLAIVALAALVPLVCNEFDLSVGAIAGLSSIFVATALGAGTPIPLVIALGVGIGVLAGIINAILVTQVRVNAVIATLGTSIIIAGIINMKTGGAAITGNIPASFTDFGTGTTLGIPRPAFALALAALALYFVLNHTPFGRYLYAFGSNRSAARLVGLRTNLLLGLTFVIAGALAGGAGALHVARAGSADPRVGDNLTLLALAAAFLSAAAIRPGRYNVGGTMVAIFFLAVLNSGLNLAGAPEYIGNYVNGAALIIGVGLAVHMGRRRGA